MILSKLNPIAPLLIEFNQPFAKVAIIKEKRRKIGDRKKNLVLPVRDVRCSVH